MQNMFGILYLLLNERFHLLCKHVKNFEAIVKEHLFSKLTIATYTELLVCTKI